MAIPLNQISHPTVLTVVNNANRRGQRHSHPSLRRVHSPAIRCSAAAGRDSGNVPVDPKEAGAAVRSGFRILDVRPEWERNRAFVEGSVHVPLLVEDRDAGPVTLLKKWVHFGYIGLWTGQLLTTINEEFCERVEEAVPDKETRLLVACGEGLRSLVAIRKLHEKGYVNLRWLAGGFNRVPENDLPVVEINSIKHQIRSNSPSHRYACYKIIEFEFEPEIKSPDVNIAMPTKSSNFSFGVVLLELVTGRKAIDNTRSSGEHNLVAWARPLFKDRRKFPQMADPLLQGQHPMRGLHQALLVAAMCLQEQANMRPVVADVVTALTYLASQKYDPEIHPVQGSQLSPATPSRSRRGSDGKQIACTGRERTARNIVERD